MDLGRLQSATSINVKFFLSYDNTGGPGDIITWTVGVGISINRFLPPKPRTCATTLS